MGRKLRNLVDMRAKEKYKDAIIIDSWGHLKEWYGVHGPSETHEIIFEDHSGFIRSLNKDDKGRDSFHYLSTHSFYGHGRWIDSTQALNRTGFKGIIIRNWDGATENQVWPDRTYVPPVKEVAKS